MAELGRDDVGVCRTVGSHGTLFCIDILGDEKNATIALYCEWLVRMRLDGLGGKDQPSMKAARPASSPWRRLPWPLLAKTVDGRQQ